MQIAIDVRSLCDVRPSGVGHALYEILNAWPDSHEALVLFSCGKRAPKLPRAILQQPNVRAVHRTAPNKIINALIALRFLSLERIIGASVDVVWFPNTGFLPRTRTRTVVTVHDLAFHLLPSTYTWKHHLWYVITRALSTIKHADDVIAISSSTARDVVRLSPKGRVHTVLHGVNDDRFTARVQPSDTTWLQRYGIRRPYILFLATIEPRKNAPSLIEAFDAVAATHGTLQLVIAGGRGWKRRSFERALKTAVHRDRIQVLGYVSDDARPALLRQALALCLPSRYEGFGMQILEAMACGTPVVCSHNSSLPEVGGTAPLYVRAMNVREFERALEHILSSSDLRARCRNKGIAQAARFSWKETATTIFYILKK